MSQVSIGKLAEEWLTIDVNPKTRQEIIDLSEANNVEELELRLRHRIVFGTAGLRAKMEAGFSRMNNVTVLQASQGLASYILQQNHIDDPSVVIGHDHRHNSEEFAKIAALAFILKGIKVYYLGPEIVATPMVPFAVDEFKLSAGIMVTASHNPAADNGYKVYWGNGCQIIPPHDLGIHDLILNNLEPVEGSWDFDLVLSSSPKLLILQRQDIIEKYLLTVRSKLVHDDVAKGLRAVYTPMHGVGLEFVRKVLSFLGLEIVVPKEQADPDPDFHTVKFPNPEEKGALDLAIATAEEHGLDLVLLNDPDADRFSLVIKHEGTWRQLTGNELGFLFAQYIVESNADKVNSKMAMLNSTVSSQMIRSMLQKLGFHYGDTLTGFKWIGNKAIDLELEGYEVPFAYEEAIGFMFNVVHDKDGISAFAVFVQMYQHWISQGTNAVNKLKEGFEKFGYFKEFNGYYLVPDLDTTPNIFNNVIRKYGSTPHEKSPKKIGDYIVKSYRDLTIGYDSSTADNVPLLPVDPSSQMITAELVPSSPSSPSDFVRFTARGSGTEPKLKLYIEGKSDSEEKAHNLAKDVWFLLEKEWFKPDIHNLTAKY